MFFVNFGVLTMMQMRQNGDLMLKNGSKMGQKWPKFSFFSAEMTGTQVKSVKIVDPQLDTIMSCKKTKFPPKKSIFRQFLAKNGKKWAKLRKNRGNSQL